MSHNFPPLQSHNLTKREWVPSQSKSRFVVWEKSDECWMKPLGLGSFVTKLQKFYDVRLENDVLIGYCSLDPTTVSRSRRFQLAVMPPIKFNSLLSSIHISAFRIDLEICLYQVKKDTYYCWKVRDETDADLLIKHKWIKIVANEWKEYVGKHISFCESSSDIV